MKIEVKFDRDEIDRLWAGIPRGPVGVTRLIKEAALAGADRRAAALEERRRESA